MWFQSFLRPKPKPVPQAITAYALDERRTDRYTFTSMKALMRYFATWLPEEDIDAMVEAAKEGFIVRRGCSEEETRLQFLKKCEYSLVRLLRSGVAAA